METVRVVRNEEFLAVAHGILSWAKRSVDICTYKFEFSQRPAARGLNLLIGRLYALADIGVRVRVLLETSRRRGGLTRINENAAKALKAHGIEVRTLPDDRCQHAKMLLVDDCLGIIGSHNWTPKAMTENFEVSVRIQNPGYLAGIVEHFNKIWEGSKKM